MEMPNYTVEWAIDCWDAESPKEAARKIVRQYFGNIGTADHFTVTDQETGEVTELDAFSGEEGPIYCDTCGLAREDFHTPGPDVVCCDPAEEEEPFHA